ncbi:lactonase family protein [uncultured Bacteroides sp.]|uniref:lactonase family protein n=1 Tax=uncultured Bacteroides sp. TaxID=162156 RepID=UPI00263385C1|nr:lactonase family protein [uncultured Bacteroides sp.]
MLFSNCTPKANSQSKDETSNDSLYMLVGSYAPATDEGIKVFVFNQETGEAIFRSGVKGISNPSYLVPSKDGSKVFAVGEDEGETATANALAFDMQKGRLQLVNSRPTHGGAPCNITLSPKEDYAVTANYFGGNISIFPIDNQGKLQEADTINFTGKSIHPERQTHPYLHCVYFTPDSLHLHANDLGTDKIHVFPLNENGRPDRKQAYDVPLIPGSGPRHACFAPNGNYFYVITELSGEVVAMSYKDGRIDTIQVIKADTLNAAGSADIHISPDGKFLYASNRLKGDGIAIFAINPADGKLTKTGYQPTGIHPRNFIITPNGKYLLVACRDTNEIQVFQRNPDTGLLKDTGKTIKMNKPVCLKFVEK